MRDRKLRGREGGTTKASAARCPAKLAGEEQRKAQDREGSRSKALEGGQDEVG